jgi:hypothetical protein
MKIVPFWKLQTRSQVGLDVGFTLTKFDYMRDYDFWQLQLDLVVIRITADIWFKNKKPNLLEPL